MAVETSSCNDCEHVKVCRFKDDYKYAAQQACHLEIKEPFKMTILCPHYLQVTVYRI